MVKVSVEENRIVVPFNGKRGFSANITLKEHSIKKCLDFAEMMVYGDGYQNPNSFGNEKEPRVSSEVFRDILQGKISEIGFYNFMFKQKIIPDKKPDFEVWGKGKWEDIDFTFNNGEIRISIKSTKHFGNLLLLEKHKYTKNGEFNQPVDGGEPFAYDNTFLVRVKGIDGGNRSEYDNISSVQCEISGHIDHARFLSIIAENQVVPQGCLLGTPLKVDNYYTCVTDLISTDKFLKFS